MNPSTAVSAEARSSVAMQSAFPAALAHLSASFASTAARHAGSTGAPVRTAVALHVAFATAALAACLYLRAVHLLAPGASVEASRALAIPATPSRLDMRISVSSPVPSIKRGPPLARDQNHMATVRGQGADRRHQGARRAYSPFAQPSMVSIRRLRLRDGRRETGRRAPHGGSPRRRG